MSGRKIGIGRIVHNNRPVGPIGSKNSDYNNGYINYDTSNNGDGYLSDVQTYNSNNESEMSQDFYSSTRSLEQQIKDKFKFLRESYESRINHLVHVVNNTCESLYSDELLIEMKSDRISSAFIPAHLGESNNSFK